MIEESKIKEVVDRIAKGFNPEKIILFGSYAAGNATEDSDLDLIIVKETNEPVLERGKDIRFSLMGTKIAYDLLIFTSEEFKNKKSNKYSFLNEALKTSKILYERTK